LVSFDWLLESAAVSGQIAMMDHLHAEGARLPLPVPVTVTRIVTKGARTAALAWLAEHQDIVFPPEALLIAIKQMNLSAVRLMLARSCPRPDPDFLSARAVFSKPLYGKRLDVIQFLVENLGAPITADVVQLAISANFAAGVRYVAPKCSQLTPSLFMSAVMRSTIAVELLDALLEAQCPWDDAVVRYATRYGSHETQQWTLRHCTTKAKQQ